MSNNDPSALASDLKCRLQNNGQENVCLPLLGVFRRFYLLIVFKCFDSAKPTRPSVLEVIFWVYEVGFPCDVQNGFWVFIQEGGKEDKNCPAPHRVAFKKINIL